MWLATVFGLALLSLAGISPLAGFAGKVFLLTAAIDGNMAWLAALAAVNMAIGLYCYVAIIADMFFAAADNSVPIRADVGYGCAAALAIAGKVIPGKAPDAALAQANAALWLR